MKQVKVPEKAFVVIVEVWTDLVRDEMENKAVKKTLTIPKWLNDAAEMKKINFSQLLQFSLKKQIGINRTDSSIKEYLFEGEEVKVEKEPFLITLSYNDYIPGMKLYLRNDHEQLKKGDVVEIKEMNGYDKETQTYKFPWGKESKLYFITKDNVKIIWNEVPVSCYIERDPTTSFIEKMYNHYKDIADRNMKDVANYEWEQRHYDEFIEEKYGTLLELLVQYEHMKIFKS